MLTKKKLIEMLSVYSDDARVITEQGEDIIHIVNLNDGSIILSDKKPIGTCNRTGGYVYPTEILEYDGFCPELGEDLYSFEFTEIKENKK